MCRSVQKCNQVHQLLISVESVVPPASFACWYLLAGIWFVNSLPIVSHMVSYSHPTYLLRIVGRPCGFLLTPYLLAENSYSYWLPPYLLAANCWQAYVPHFIAHGPLMDEKDYGFVLMGGPPSLGSKSRSKQIIQSLHGCTFKATRGEWQVGVHVVHARKVVGLGLEVGVGGSGHWIGYSTWRQHAKEEEMRIKLQQSGDDAILFEANFLTATLSEPHAEDSVLSSHSMQIQHSSNRLPGRPPEGELCGVDVDMVDILQTSNDVTHDTNETTVVFIQLPELSSPDTPGPLDGKKNALFLAHKSAIEKTIELVQPHMRNTRLSKLFGSHSYPRMAEAES
ncbi:hypothetical protein BKA83DRAFT_4124747 [Pisolithus microcarpus]|nr:hypothetical protein BKA83DRAFT_4124747 [Pisolithus microcarpus]